MAKKPHPSRIFKTPEELEKAWTEYKESLKKESTKWGKVQYVGRDGSRVEDYPKLPLIQDGFEVFCYENYGCVGQYFDNKDGYYDDFVAICTRIKKECRADQIYGGLLNMYNTSITQRLNGLADKKELDHKGGINIPNVPDIGDRNK